MTFHTDPIAVGAGGPINARTLHRAFKGMLRAADLPDIRFHDLRHCYASFLLATGVNDQVLQENLGHSTITITKNTYTHLMSSMKADAAEKLEETLTEQSEHGSMLRVMVMPGSNGGFQYMLGVEKEPKDDDVVIDADKIKVLVDSESAPLVEGAQIDYIEGLIRSGFVISNPNFQPEGGGCACGGGGCGGGGGGGGCGCGGH